MRSHNRLVSSCSLSTAGSKCHCLSPQAAILELVVEPLLRPAAASSGCAGGAAVRWCAEEGSSISTGVMASSSSLYEGDDAREMTECRWRWSPAGKDAIALLGWVGRIRELSR